MGLKMKPATKRIMRSSLNLAGLLFVLGVIAAVIIFFATLQPTTIHDIVIPITIVNAREIAGTIKENHYTTNLVFDWNPADSKFMGQTLSIGIENLDTKQTLFAGYRYTSGIEIKTSIPIKPGGKAEVFKGRVTDLIENKGIGLSRDPVRAKFTLSFDTPQKPEDLSRIVVRSYYINPGP